MKVFKDIGSKERLFEMMKSVNKMTLNENMGGFLDPKQTLELSFNELKSGKLQISQANTQVEGDETALELVCTDNVGNTITFRFSAFAAESTDDGVFDIGDAKLTSFSFDPSDGSQGLDLDEPNLNEFNAQHQGEMTEIVSNYADVDVDAPVDLDEVGKIIDGIQANLLQTPKNYVDKKPVNPAIRVDNASLDAFIRETEDFINMFGDGKWQEKQRALTNKFANNREFENTLNDEQKGMLAGMAMMAVAKENNVDPIEVFTKFEYDNRVKDMVNKKYNDIINDKRLGALNEKWEDDVDIKKTGEHAGKTIDQLQKELDALKGKKPYDREKAGELSFAIRAKRDWKGGVDEDSLEAQSMYKSDAEEPELSPDGEASLEAQSIMNTDMDEGDYPNPIGKEISPQSSYPKKRKKYDTKVRLKTGKPKPTSIAEYEDEEDDFLAGYELPELPDAKAAQKAAMADMDGVQEPEPEDMYGDVTVSHGEKIDPMYNHTSPLTNPTLYDYPLREDDEPEEKKIGGEIKMSPEDNDRMLQIAGIKKNGEEPVGDQIEGGLADDEDAQGFDPEQVLKGMEVEMEHTDDPKVALEIALDHLVELPDYYTRLDKMEKEAGVEGGEEKPEDGEAEEEKDELLGFKPHNVGDYVDGGEEEELDETFGTDWIDPSKPKVKLVYPPDSTTGSAYTLDGFNLRDVEGHPELKEFDSKLFGRITKLRAYADDFKPVGDNTFELSSDDYGKYVRKLKADHGI